MNDTDELLPTMMRRATDRLQPDAADLVQRGMRRGRQLRRRRTVGICVAAATAVVLTATGAVAARAFLPDRGAVEVATPSKPTAKAHSPKPTPIPSPTKPMPAIRASGEKETLEALRQIVPAGFEISRPKSWSGDGYAAARITVDDANGLSELTVLVEYREPHAGCSKGGFQTCTVLPDGTVALGVALEPVYASDHPSDRGVVYNNVDLYRPDGLVVRVTSYNSMAEKGSPVTRKFPPFSVDLLTELASGARWNVPPPTAGNKLPAR